MSALVGLLAVGSLAVAGTAAAETSKLTYAIPNVDAYRDHVFVAWPRACGSDGAPLGNVSLDRNPEWKKREHEVDYEVVEKGARHEVSSFCASTMRIHALDAAAFPRGSRVATADDVALGHEVGKPFTILPALDALSLGQRIPFFADDPRQTTLAFRFDTPPASAPDARAAKAIHYDLVLDEKRELHAKRAIYTYLDGPPEVVELMPTSVAPTAPASAPPSASTSDRGTRWVYLAAVIGLVAGGVMAYFQKKKTPKV